MSNKSVMQLADVYDFFQNPPPLYLNRELAVCYILSVLRDKDSCSMELMQSLEQGYSTYRLSDTILFSALRFLEKEGFITGYLKRVEKRGRPRRMYRLAAHAQAQVQEVTQFWQAFLSRQHVG